MHRIERALVLPASLGQAWQFFSQPQNLSLITPPSLRLRICGESAATTFAGQIIEYTVQALPCWHTRWVTEITHCLEPHLFVDEQRFGPYRFWHHLHRFEAIPGGTLVVDKVHYLLPRYPAASLVHRFYIRPRLEEIFSFREESLRRLFPGAATP
ncbi:MAG: SRPBCC family protein [Bdellovibrionota bacterium]|nr:MAG: SRPBCC family protein [Bdellovibrionota bacterium]